MASHFHKFSLKFSITLKMTSQLIFTNLLSTNAFFEKYLPSTIHLTRLHINLKLSLHNQSTEFFNLVIKSIFYFINA